MVLYAEGLEDAPRRGAGAAEGEAMPGGEGGTWSAGGYFLEGEGALTEEEGEVLFSFCGWCGGGEEGEGIGGMGDSEFGK